MSQSLAPRMPSSFALSEVLSNLGAAADALLVRIEAAAEVSGVSSRSRGVLQSRSIGRVSASVLDFLSSNGPPHEAATRLSLSLFHSSLPPCMLFQAVNAELVRRARRQDSNTTFLELLPGGPHTDVQMPGLPLP